MPFAVRAYSANWQATAATHVNTIPVVAVARPRATAPATGRSAAMRAIASTVPIRTLAPPATAIPAVSSGVASDGCRGEQLGPPAVLVRPRVAGHGEDRHQAGEHGEQAADPPGGEPARGGQVERRTVQHGDRGVAADRRGQPGPLGSRRVEGLVGVGHARRQDAEDDDPDRQRHPIAAQRQADQGPCPAHRVVAGAVSGSPFVE